MIPGAVAVGYLHPGEVAQCFAVSLRDMMLHDISNDQRIFGHPHGEMALETSPLAIVEARNSLAKLTLSSEAEWLFLVDADMGFAGDTLERLIEAADPETRPIVGALAFAHKADGSSSHHGRRFRATPTLYSMYENDHEIGFVPMFDYPRDRLVEVDATGAACILIHRNALQKVRDRYGDTWFDRIMVPKAKTPFGEDMSFCLRAKACEIPVHVHTGVTTTHYKGGVYLDERFYDEQQARIKATPAVTTIDVLIPTLGRPHRVVELAANVHEATVNPHNLAFICEAHDEPTIQAVKDAGLTPIINDRAPCYGGAINTGFTQTSGAWVFTGADDLRFGYGWDVQCLAAAGGWFTVIGTNDHLNQRVTAGRHSTHSLVYRAWLLQEGGVLDEGPGSFLHEGYSHNFVDHEFVSSAKMRGKFRPCLTATVEHVHHLNGGAPLDATYEKGVKDWDADAALFAQRAGLWAGL